MSRLSQCPSFFPRTINDINYCSIFLGISLLFLFLLQFRLVTRVAAPPVNDLLQQQEPETVEQNIVDEVGVNVEDYSVSTKSASTADGMAITMG